MRVHTEGLPLDDATHEVVEAHEALVGVDEGVPREAGVRCLDRARRRGGVPGIHRVEIEDPGIGALPGRLRDLAHEGAGLDRLDGAPILDRLQVPVPVGEVGL